MDLAATGRETLAIVDQGVYVSRSGRTVEIGPSVAAAQAGTRLYTPSELAAAVAAAPKGTRTARVEVTAESTAEAGRRLAAEGGSIAVLNFASARRVGGGFIGGARAQEEELCRASALYRCLETVPAYYAANRAEASAVYTDHAIWSPQVPFFRDESRELVDEPYRLSVITAPAPNTGAVVGHEPEALRRIGEAFGRRAAMVLALAELEQHEVLVLGAWGCGAFQGDPVVAADAFGRALDGRFAGSFARVVFAVLARNAHDMRNLSVFRQRLEG